jgi:hypothetical protein
MKKINLTLFAFLCCLTLQTLAVETVTSTDLILNANQMNQSIKDLKNFKVVMPGVLYRGGNSSGGAVPLTTKGLSALCEKGFSQAVYMYPDAFTQAGSKSCAIDYTTFGGAIRDRSKIEGFLKRVFDVIVNKKGPLYVHCWNGWHASGEMAAMALMQFCGWNGAKAADYWQANVGDKAYPSIQQRIQNFQPFSELQISSEQRAEICPRD